MKTLNEVTIFKTPSSKETAVIHLEQLYQYIQNGRWRELVARIRQALAEGNKAEAERLKKQLAYVCYGGLFKGGSHAASAMETYNPIIVLDYDHVPVELLDALKDTAMLCEHTMMTFVTPSGQGLKVVVLTNASREHHAVAYRQVANFYDGLFSRQSDRACKDISHGHFASHDADARYQEVVKPFEVVVPTDEIPVEAPCEEPVPDSAPQKQGTADEFVRACLLVFPASEGERNVRLFQVACKCRERGLPVEEVTRAAIRQMQDGTFNDREIASVVKSAYSRDSDESSKKKSQKASANCPRTAQLPYTVKQGTISVDEEDEIPDGEDLREHTPLFPEKVFGQLPEFVSTALKYVTEKRERDILLLSILTVCSALVYTVSGFYSRRRYYACFYTFVIAPAACGKGVMDDALALCKHYFKEMADENTRLEKKYKKEYEEYEKSLRRGKKEEPSLSRPEEPVYRYVHIPATVSKSRFLQHLRDNKEMTSLIVELEADTLSVTGQLDYGNYFDFLRKIFHHEKVANSFKTDVKPTYVENPKLAMLMAGTPAQLHRYIRTSEDGLYSRQLFYTYRQQLLWKDVSPFEDEGEVEDHLNRMAMRLNMMIHFLKSSPTKVRLTPEQWKRLNGDFAALLAKEAVNDRDDFQSCIKRYSLITFRICMVLTALEKATLRMDVQEMYCSDANFDTALSIVTCCLEHSRLLITSLSPTDKDSRELSNPNKIHVIFNRLPSLFTSSQFVEIAESLDIRERSAFKMLKKSIGVFVSKLQKGVYKKLS